MKVKIVNSKFESYWYSENIGEVFDVRNYDAYNYQVINSTFHLISKTDCEVIDDFVLPKKWFIKGSKKFNSWLNETNRYAKSNIHGKNNDGFYYNPTKDFVFWDYELNKPSDYKEITFDQFLKYVLKENNMETMKDKGKITGYKLLKDLPDVKKGAIGNINPNDGCIDFIFSNTLPDGANMCSYTQEFCNQKTTWFKPIYSTKPELIKILDYDVKKINKESVKIGCQVITLKELEAVKTLDKISKFIKSHSGTRMVLTEDGDVLFGDDLISSKQIDQLINFIKEKK